MSALHPSPAFVPGKAGLSDCMPTFVSPSVRKWEVSAGDWRPEHRSQSLFPTCHFHLMDYLPLGRVLAWKNKLFGSKCCHQAMGMGEPVINKNVRELPVTRLSSLFPIVK